MSATHLDIFDYTFTLSANPPTRQGFGKPLLIAPLATNSLNSQDTLSFANLSEAQAALTAGYIEQVTFDRVSIGFQQAAKPNAIKVGAVDLVGLETWGEAFTRILQADSDFYGVLATTRTAADIVSLATAVEADGTRQFFFQAGDADWLTTGVPAAYSSIDAFERVSGIFHDTATQYHDMAWVCDRLAFDPDTASVDWRTLLTGTTGLATGLTSAQRDFLTDTNHMNVALPLNATYPQFVSPGQNQSGRSIYEYLTVDWYKARTQEDLAALLVNLAARGEKLVVGQTGQQLVSAILERYLNQGSNLASPHFIAGETRVTAEDITQVDRDAGQMRFTVEAQLAASARRLVFNIFFQNTPLES